MELAKGGIVPRGEARYELRGEHGPELVIPLSRKREATPVYDAICRERGWIHVTINPSRLLGAADMGRTIAELLARARAAGVPLR